MAAERSVRAEPARAAVGAAAGDGRLAGHAALWAVQLCFGLFPVFGKWAIGPAGFSPLAVGAWRIAFAALALGALALALHGRRALPTRRDLARLAVGSFLGITANMALYLEGLARSTATNAGLVVCLIPVFTFAIAAAVRQEPFLPLRALGLAVALGGASLLFWAERPELVAAHGLGNLLMALNTLSYAAYLVTTRPLSRRYPPIAVIAWVFVLALPFVPLLTAADMAGHADGVAKGALEVWFPPAATREAWLALGFVLVFPTAVAYLLNVFALSRLRASTTAVYVYLQSLITAAASALFLGERPTRALALAAACIFAGIWLVSRRPAPKAAAAAPEAG